VRAVAILHIPDSPFGAVRQGYSDLARTLAARGDRLDVITPERFPITSRLHARWWVLVLPFAVALWLWRRRRQYDAAVFHSYTGWVFNFLPARLPTITQFHGVEPLFYDALREDHLARGRDLSLPFRVVYGWLMPRALRASCRRSRVVTCLNDTERRYLLEHAWTTADRLVLLRQGVPQEFFADGRVYAPRATRLLVMSQWLETKGTRYVVEAFTALARAHPDLQLSCYGTRAPEATVLAAFPADVRHRVTAVEEIDHRAMARPYGRADVFLHASLSEGSGRAVMQAMAAALPIVVTPIGLVPDLLQDGRDCLIVPKRDSRAIQSAVERLLDDAGLRREFGTRVRRIAEVFQPLTCEGEHADLVRSVAARASPRA
jgi:glycosyltransferase involved in cell wall biosynthesis